MSKKNIILLFLGTVIGVSASSAWHLFHRARELRALSEIYTEVMYDSDAIRARSFAELLFCEGRFMRNRILNYMNFFVELWIYGRLAVSAGKESRDFSETFSLFFADEERASRFFETYHVTDEMKVRIKAICEDGARSLEKSREKAEEIECAPGWDYVRRELFLSSSGEYPVLFSYQRFINEWNEKLYYGDEDMTEFFIERDLHAQYIAKGRSKCDESGNWNLYFLLDKNHVLDCPMDADGLLCSPMQVKTFAQLNISSSGYWSVEGGVGVSENEN